MTCGGGRVGFWWCQSLLASVTYDLALASHHLFFSGVSWLRCLWSLPPMSLGCSKSPDFLEALQTVQCWEKGEDRLICPQASTDWKREGFHKYRGWGRPSSAEHLGGPTCCSYLGGCRPGCSNLPGALQTVRCWKIGGDRLTCPQVGAH